MEFQLPIQMPTYNRKIRYGDRILLTGSCFTEHIGGPLREGKFDILQNPNGILFDPASVASSLISYIDNRQYGPEDLVFFNELWQSWQHHSSFSHIDRSAALQAINESQTRAHRFLKEAKWLVITLGSAFSYRLVTDAPAPYRTAPVTSPASSPNASPANTHPADPSTTAGPVPAAALPASPYPVANCHRAPGQVFRKHLMTIEEINISLDSFLYQLFLFNPEIQVLFTVSPVRHVRDGVIENNRSKARLIESVHHLVNKFDRLWYFPAYELVIDVLRDYRFYDIDLVHPNYAATSYVLDLFIRHLIDEPSQRILEEVRKIAIARKHKPFQPSTQAHKRFLDDHRKKTADLAALYPFLDLREELAYFSAGAG